MLKADDAEIVIKNVEFYRCHIGDTVCMIRLNLSEATKFKEVFESAYSDLERRSKLKTDDDE